MAADPSSPGHREKAGTPRQKTGHPPVPGAAHAEPPDGLYRILEAHEQWLDGQGGSRMELCDVDLSVALLKGKNLARADLRGCDLHANNLSETDLTRANLSSADLRQADLSQAALAQADLQWADLADARHLTPNQLAGADLYQAHLPETVVRFENVTAVGEQSRTAQKLCVSMLLTCAYALLTILTTHDAQLLGNSISFTLPLIGTTVPIVGFYWMVPCLLIGLQAYVLSALQELWEGLIGLPARFPDGTPVYKKAGSWFYNSFVQAHFPFLRDLDASHNAQMQRWLFVLLAWCTVPGTLSVFWHFYLHRQDAAGTTVHLVLLTASMVLSLRYYHRAVVTLGGQGEESPSSRSGWRWLILLPAACLLVVLSAVSYPSVLGINDYARANMRGAAFHGLMLENAHLIGADLWTADLHEADLTNAQLTEAHLLFADLHGAHLVSGNLHRAQLVGANLTDADLTGADLTEANLTGARLQGARLSGADLTEANLTEARLQGARLSGAVLSGANLSRANLTRAILSASNVHGGLWIKEAAGQKGAERKDLYYPPANLDGADLTQAILDHADLREASFVRANLTGARMTGLTFKTIVLPQYEIQFMGPIFNHAILLSADLSGDDLRGLPLLGANLDRAKLRGADLRGAQLSDSRFRMADLRKVNLAQASLAGATLTLEDADLAGADLREVRDVPTDRIIEARNWLLALYRDDLLSRLGLTADHNVRVQAHDFSGCRLNGLNLSDTDLSGYNLAGAHLRGATLMQARFSGADLDHADLRGADLTGADLSRARKLDSALLHGAQYDPTTKWPAHFGTAQHQMVLDKW